MDMRFRTPEDNSTVSIPRIGTAESTAAKTLLCIDDEPNILTLRKVVLERAGYEVLAADNGAEGISLFQSNVVHGVVLDYMMPKMDGEQVACALKRIESSIPIILVSGCVSIPGRVLRLVDAFVQKADGPEALIKTLSRQLRFP
jgi:response regulator RpfG family c-di-GMP phosphodiesterase